MSVELTIFVMTDPYLITFAFSVPSCLSSPSIELNFGAQKLYGKSKVSEIFNFLWRKLRCHLKSHDKKKITLFLSTFALGVWKQGFHSLICPWKQLQKREHQTICTKKVILLKAVEKCIVPDAARCPFWSQSTGIAVLPMVATWS